MLTLLNEREYDDGSNGRIGVPLDICVGASNEFPQDDSLQALYDRFAVRFWVSYMQHEDNLAALIGRHAAMGGLTATVTAQDIEQARRNSKAVQFGPEAVALLLEIRRALLKESVTISDRRLLRCVGLIKASAWLDGRAAVCPDDFEVLCDVLWDELDQRSPVMRAVLSRANPHLDKAKGIVEAVKAATLPLQQTTNANEVVEVLKDVREALGEIKQLAAQSNSSKIHALAAEVGEYEKRCMATMTRLIGF